MKTHKELTLTEIRNIKKQAEDYIYQILKKVEEETQCEIENILFDIDETIIDNENFNEIEIQTNWKGMRLELKVKDE